MITPIYSVFSRKIKREFVLLCYQRKNSCIRNYIPGQIKADILISPKRQKYESSLFLKMQSFPFIKMHKAKNRKFAQRTDINS